MTFPYEVHKDQDTSIIKLKEAMENQTNGYVNYWRCWVW